MGLPNRSISILPPERGPYPIVKNLQITADNTEIELIESFVNHAQKHGIKYLIYFAYTGAPPSMYAFPLGEPMNHSNAGIIALLADANLPNNGVTIDRKIRAQAGSVYGADPNGFALAASAMAAQAGTVVFATDNHKPYGLRFVVDPSVDQVETPINGANYYTVTIYAFLEDRTVPLVPPDSTVLAACEASAGWTGA